MATETTTVCDKCGQKCTYGMVRIMATTTHWTGQREHVGEDYYKPLELCITCGGVAADVLGLQENADQTAHTRLERLEGEWLAEPHIEIRPQPPIDIGGGIELHRRGPVMEREDAPVGRHR